MSTAYFPHTDKWARGRNESYPASPSLNRPRPWPTFRTPALQCVGVSRFH
nr:MAG TPA: hypothetical protein [Caudoviricetes sp.]